MVEKMFSARPKVVEQKSNSIISRPKLIMTTKDSVSNCIKCSGKTEKNYTVILAEDNKVISVTGQWCWECGILFAQNRKRINMLKKLDASGKSYLFGVRVKPHNTSEYLEKIRQRKEEQRIKLNETHSAEMMICVQFDEGTKKDYIIVTSAKEADNDTIIHYTSPLGLELITAACEEERGKKGSFKGKEFTVRSRTFKHEGQQKLPEYIALSELRIQSKGGYLESIKNNQQKIVDVLLYSLFTKKYEIVHATYDQLSQESYIDITLFRTYIRKYGRPKLCPTFEIKKRNGAFSFDELRTESILMEYGYSVSKGNGLSEYKRRELLTEIVDLEILTVKEVVSFLDFFIQTHPDSKYYEARYKWEEDKEFIQSYNVNPERFLIAK